MKKKARRKENAGMRPTFKEATSNMNSKQKREYIWEYYKIHIMTTLFILFLVGYSAYEVATNRAAYLNIELTGVGVVREEVEQFEYHLNNVFLTEEQQRQYRVFVQHTPFMAGNEQGQPELIQRLVVHLAAGQIDLLVVEKESLVNFRTQEFLMPLDKLNMDLDGVELVEVDGMLVGIPMSEVEWIDDIYQQGEWFVTVPVTTGRVERVETLLEYLLDR